MRINVVTIGKIMIVFSDPTLSSIVGKDATVDTLNVQYAHPKKPIPIGGKISLG